MRGDLRLAFPCLGLLVDGRDVVRCRPVPPLRVERPAELGFGGDPFGAEPFAVFARSLVAVLFGLA